MTTRAKPGWLIVLVGLAVVGCGGDDGGTKSTLQGATGGVGGGPGVGGTGGGGTLVFGNPPGATEEPGMAACSSCEWILGDACVVAVVSRAQDTATLPWTLHPTEADGSGDLLMRVEHGGAVGRARVAADFTEADATHTIATCAPHSDGQLTVFLDDDRDGGEAMSSSDPPDACPARAIVGIVVSYDSTLTVPITLTRSCAGG